MQALDVLASLNLIPAMYCEAADLLNMPSLSLDPVSEQVALNSQTLESLIATVARLEGQFPPLLSLLLVVVLIKVVVQPRIVVPVMPGLLPLLPLYLLLMSPTLQC